jgi:hypothetical protein
MIPEPTSDERYLRAAKLELLGPDFVHDPNLHIPPDTLSRIMERADELKRANPPKPPIFSAELIAKLRELGPQDFNVVMHLLADHVYDARLRDGRHLRDAMDFKQWLQELGEEGKP